VTDHTETATKSPLQVVHDHMAAEDRQDLDATLATFTEDCYYSVPGLGIELRGKAEIRRWYEELFAAIPDFRNSEEKYWETDRQIFFSAYMEGTHKGTWHGWPATGRSFRSPMLVRIPIAADGLMEAEIVYNDSADVFMQLGILPRQGSRQERLLQALYKVRGRLPGRR
jgi:steroid delta-isomerase-like uncharacterized protein